MKIIKYFVILRFSACMPGFKKKMRTCAELPIFFLIPRLLLPVSSDMLLGVLTRIYFHQKEILLIRDMVVECWNRQHHGQTIHPIENLIPMHLFKILCVVTWAWLFLTSEVIEAVIGQKHPLEAKNGIKELIYWKMYLIKVY